MPPFTVASLQTIIACRPDTRPMPAIMPAPGTSPSYMSQAASWPISRNGEPGSSSRSTRSRGSNLPRDDVALASFSRCRRARPRRRRREASPPAPGYARRARETRRCRRVTLVSMRGALMPASCHDPSRASTPPPVNSGRSRAGLASWPAPAAKDRHRSSHPNRIGVLPADRPADIAISRPARMPGEARARVTNMTAKPSRNATASGRGCGARQAQDCDYPSDRGDTIAAMTSHAVICSAADIVHAKLPSFRCVLMLPVRRD